MAKAGVGYLLVEAAIKRARNWDDFCRLELEVAPWNDAAIRLYENAGFLIEAWKAKAINLRGWPEDMLLMARTW